MLVCKACLVFSSSGAVIPRVCLFPPLNPVIHTGPVSSYHFSASIQNRKKTIVHLWSTLHHIMILKDKISKIKPIKWDHSKHIHLHGGMYEIHQS